MSFFIEYIVPFLVVLTILVVVHELGHYLVARYNGVKVKVFSVGFGPELVGWTDKAQTRWKISLIPLGGYVLMFGDADASSRPDFQALAEASEDERSYSLHGKSVGQRAAISAAGPLANFLFAFVALTILAVVKGFPHYPAKVGEVLPESQAAQVGLRAGDEILKVNNEPVKNFLQFRAKVKDVAQEGNITLQINRSTANAKTLLNIYITPEFDSEKKTLKPLGIKPPVPEFTSLGLFAALWESLRYIGMSCWLLVEVLGQLFMGKGSEFLGGVISIGSMASDSAKMGWESLLFMMAAFSINLGMVNFLPIPVLDGGHLLFYGIEAIRGRPVSEKVQEYAFIVGLIIVMTIMCYTTWEDITRFKLFSYLWGKSTSIN